MNISNTGRRIMAKSKEKKHKHEPPIKVGDKYLCPHCRIELPYNKDCPACKLGIDWTKI
jgi:hypothetical protein